MLTAENIKYNTNTATACTPIHAHRFQHSKHEERPHPLFVQSIIADLFRNLIVVAFVFVVSVAFVFVVSTMSLWVATTCKTGEMMAATRIWFSRVSVILSEQTPRRLGLHFSLPGPLLASASTVPATVCRFYHDRPTAGNRCLCRVGNSTGGSISLASASRAFDIERYRGGSQHHVWQQRRNGRRRNFHLRENQKNHEREHEAPTTNKNDDNRNANVNPLKTLIRSQRRVTKVVRQGAGAMFSLVGFVAASCVSFATDRRSFQDRFVEPIQALSNYLKTSG